MALYFQVLASGSKGNATLVCSERTRILVDAGLSAKELSRRLDRAPVRPHELDGIVLSHEHQDHVRGCGTLSRRCGCPVYLSGGTLDHLPSQVGTLPHRQIFQSGKGFAIGDLLIHPFAISHDAGEPAGFVIEHDGCRLGICTDLGIATELVKARLSGCHGLVLEANHDLQLLIDGPYPWELKQRIRGRHGHLSNADSFALLEILHHVDLRAVVLAHLSEVNNHPRLVIESIQGLQVEDRWRGVSFQVGRQQDVAQGVELSNGS
ncbi:MAG: MBL fold metallo-hydrolase [Syntrophobacteraceae bacterium]|jgi:phosphoribosyl 1,2-cyclic phosphodiesterase|nr:MBL fold metallo-hydrolase [Syntrophobacteraceae bacterium]